MKVEDFFKLSDELLDGCKEIQIEKGREYTVDDGKDSVDKFANFKSIGGRLNLDPKLILMVYLLKHMDSLRTYVLYGREGSESIKSRIQDAINYLTMLYGMIEEEKEEGLLINVLKKK